MNCIISGLFSWVNSTQVTVYESGKGVGKPEIFIWATFYSLFRIIDHVFAGGYISTIGGKYY